MLNIKDYTLKSNLDSGIFSNVPPAVYHSHEALNYSRMKVLLDCPAKFYDKVEATQTMEFGTLFHMYVLEPHIFDRAVIVFDKDLRSKQNKEEKKQLQAAGYKYFIKSNDLNNLARMKNAVMSFNLGERLLSDGYPEISAFFEMDGVLCRSRFDYLKSIDDTLFITDIKTISSCSKDNITKSIGQFNYHIQAAFYSDALKICQGEFEKVIFINFFVESTKGLTNNNHISAVPVIIPEEDLEIGRCEYKRALNIYKDCTNNNNFYDYDTVFGWGGAISEIGLPAWKKTQLNF
jgi:exodeoxyribonuclease VIII